MPVCATRIWPHAARASSAAAAATRLSATGATATATSAGRWRWRRQSQSIFTGESKKKKGTTLGPTPPAAIPWSNKPPPSRTRYSACLCGQRLTVVIVMVASASPPCRPPRGGRLTHAPSLFFIMASSQTFTPHRSRYEKSPSWLGQFPPSCSPRPANRRAAMHR
jgi:hypothetical protein